MHAASSSSSSSALRLPAAFQRLAWSNLVAQSAEQVSLAAAPLVAVFALGAGARETGLLQTAQTLPFLLLSIPLGVWADRRSRRTLMTLAESVRVIAMLCVLLLLMTHALSLPLLAALGFHCRDRHGCLQRRCAFAGAVDRAARGVRPGQRPARTGAQRRVFGGTGARRTAGRLDRRGMGVWLRGGLSALAVGLLAGLREPQRAAAPQRHFLLELRDGTGFVLRDALLRPMLATAVFFNIGFFILQAVYVPYAVQRLGLSASTVGVTLGAYGVGMVCGALAAPAIARRIAFGRMLIVGPSAGWPRRS